MTTVYEFGAFLATSVGKRPPSPKDYQLVINQRKNNSDIHMNNIHEIPRSGDDDLVYHLDELPGADPPSGDGYDRQNKHPTSASLSSSSVSSVSSIVPKTEDVTSHPINNPSSSTPPEVPVLPPLSTTNEKNQWTIIHDQASGVDGLLLRASGAYHSGHLEIALTALKRADSMKPNDFRILSDLGAIQQQLWQLKEASETLEKYKN